MCSRAAARALVNAAGSPVYAVGRVAGIEPQIAVRSGQWDFLAAMAATGIGIAVLPEPLCRRLDGQRLLWLPLMPQMLWQLELIWRQNSYLSHGAQAWIVACRERWLPGERQRVIAPKAP